MGVEENKNKNGIWWKPAVEIFSEISTWIAIPIILALIVGKSLDNRYGTKPWLLLGFAGVSFLISCFGIIRAVKKYAAKIRKEEKEEKNN